MKGQVKLEGSLSSLNGLPKTPPIFSLPYASFVITEGIPENHTTKKSSEAGKRPETDYQNGQRQGRLNLAREDENAQPERPMISVDELEIYVKFQKFERLYISTICIRVHNVLLSYRDKIKKF